MSEETRAYDDTPGRRSARVAGVLLAAGAGRRMGRPKALVRGDSGEAWVVRGARVLLDSGCSPVVVVIGAAADEVEQALAEAFGHEPRLVVQRAVDWQEGMGVSLRDGLGALDAVAGELGLVGALVTLVDTPSLRVETLYRVRDRATEGDATGDGGTGADHVLAQATFDGRPAHPVFLGQAHWSTIRAELHGDTGARAYLAARGAFRIECSDLEPGDDVDNMNTTQF